MYTLGALSNFQSSYFIYEIMNIERYIKALDCIQDMVKNIANISFPIRHTDIQFDAGFKDWRLLVILTIFLNGILSVYR